VALSPDEAVRTSAGVSPASGADSGRDAAGSGRARLSGGVAGVSGASADHPLYRAVGKAGPRSFGCFRLDKVEETR